LSNVGVASSQAAPTFVFADGVAVFAAHVPVFADGVSELAVNAQLSRFICQLCAPELGAEGVLQYLL
jgi:hypothetical protein